MPAMIVKHRVANFEKWKATFDEMDPTRQAHGWTGYSLLRDATDPNLIVIVNRMSDLGRAKAYGSSDALRTAMQNAGVLGVPEIQLLEDAEERRY